MRIFEMFGGGRGGGSERVSSSQVHSKQTSDTITFADKRETANKSIKPIDLLVEITGNTYIS